MNIDKYDYIPSVASNREWAGISDDRRELFKKQVPLTACGRGPPWQFQTLDASITHRSEYVPRPVHVRGVTWTEERQTCCWLVVNRNASGRGRFPHAPLDLHPGAHKVLL